jgi:uncharacterized heparinase superfamily protein
VQPVARRASLSEPGPSARFLNRAERLHLPGSWDDPRLPLLWRYHLHYFDDLCAGDAQHRGDLHRVLIERWLAECLPPSGTAWAPYPTSLRMVNWLKWLVAGNAAPHGMLTSLRLQAEALRRRPEYHLQGNHLWENGKALLFAGLLLGAPEAPNWRTAGASIVRRALTRGVLPDGGYCERSAMYHCLVLEGVLDLINALSLCGAGDSHTHRELCGSAARMLGWLSVVTHPDGDIALFNDATLHQAAQPIDLIRYASRLGVPTPGVPGALAELPYSGFARAASGPFVLLCECGGPGPDFQPGHAHAGTLGFELSCFGQRTVVDTGVSTYEKGEERLSERGTAVHNTVAVDNRDSSEVWDSFRVARRAGVTELYTSRRNRDLVVEAAHDGWERLSVAGTHRRVWELSSAGCRILDTLGGRGSHDLTLSLLLHPSVRLRRVHAACFELRHPSWPGTLTVNCDPSLSAVIAPATYHPEFGVSLRTKRIVCYGRLTVPARLETRISLVPCAAGERAAAQGRFSEVMPGEASAQPHPLLAQHA